MALGSCLKDDIPYPHIQANFRNIEAEGVTAGPVIDSINRMVTLTFPETANIYNVNVTAYTLTPGAYIVGDSITGGIDLSQPRKVTLRLYQDYDWTISASRSVERYFSVASQIGATEIDVPGRRVLLSVSSKANLAAIEVLSCKLGPEGSTMTPELQGRTVDFTRPLEVEVDDWGHSSIWTIYVSTTDASVTTASGRPRGTMVALGVRRGRVGSYQRFRIPSEGRYSVDSCAAVRCSGARRQFPCMSETPFAADRL